MKEKIQKFYEKHKNTLLTLFGLFIILIIILVIFLLERYIIYNITYYIINLFLIKFNLENKNIISVKLEAILFVIYLNIILSRIIILSFIFPQGGIFKRILVYYEFTEFIEFINNIVLNAIENINSFKEKEVESNIGQLNMLSLTNNENMKKNNCNKINDIKNMSLKEYIFNYTYNESLIYMENFMMNYFTPYITEKINIIEDFNIYLFTPKKIGKYSDILLIFCNQNDICCEFYSVIPDNIFNYILNLKCTIIIWNYKGYGLIKGFTTFGSIDKDVDILSNYIKNNFSKYKIIVHGFSIGGYSSIKLTQKLSKCVDNVVLICDRTFSDIKDIVKGFSFGGILTLIYNIIFPKWYFKYRNVENFISLPCDKKLIIFDAKDTIINYRNGSLVYGLTKKYYTDIVKPFLNKYNKHYTLLKNFKELSEDITELKDKISKDSKRSVDINNKFEEFFMFFIIFGYPFHKSKTISLNNDNIKENYIFIPYIIKQILTKNSKLFSEKLKKFLSVMNFLFIKFNLNCNLNEDDIFQCNYKNYENRDEVFNMELNHINELKKYLGSVHRVYCGHTGELEKKDFMSIINLLKNNKYI